MAEISTSLQNLHRDVTEIYEYLRRPILNALQNHKLNDHPLVKKVILVIDRYHHVLFWAAHGWNWYFYPHPFYVGLGVGLVGTAAVKLGLSAYHCRVISTSQGMKEYPYALVIMSLFFTSLSLSLFDGFVLGGFIAHFGVIRN